MNKSHTLILIAGRTGSGKDTLVDQLCKQNNYTQLISYATRPRRDNEGDTHRFVTVSDYQEMKANGEVAAFTEINGNYYWCTISQLYESDFYIIDPKGIDVLKQLNLPNLNLVTVYINVPNEIRQQRATHQRGDDLSIFRARDLDERRQFREFLQDTKFDYAVSNIDFAKAYSVLKWICDVEGLWKNKAIEGDEDNGNNLI